MAPQNGPWSNKNIFKKLYNEGDINVLNIDFISVHISKLGSNYVSGSNDDTLVILHQVECVKHNGSVSKINKQP